MGANQLIQKYMEGGKPFREAKELALQEVNAALSSGKLKTTEAVQHFTSLKEAVKKIKNI